MRKKTRELLAKRQAESANRLTVRHESVESTQYAEARRKRRAKLKEIRKYARLQGLPPGFYRQLNVEEKQRLAIAKTEEKVSNEQKILEYEQQMKIKEDLRKTSISEVLLITQYLDDEVSKDSQ